MLLEKNKLTQQGLAIGIGALGYFVDVYDLFIFSMVRQQSLRDLPDLPGTLLQAGLELLNFQMAGVFMGGFLWGMISDQKGRVRVLFLSILIYSTANLLNAFVSSFNEYRILRFVAGFGLAGELGLAVTWVSEALPQAKRGMGATLIASIGICGGLFAALSSEFLSWRACFFLGAVLGYGLLLMRMKVSEPELFLATQQHGVSRGSLKQLFLRWNSFQRYFLLVLSGLPVWFCGGIVMVFAPEFAQQLGVGSSFRMSQCFMLSFAATALGDFSCGWLSQRIKSRKRVLFLSLVFVFCSIEGLFLWGGRSIQWFYFMIFLMSFGTGYWAVLVSFAAEQFGTNLRATVTTSVPNVVRGCVIPLTLMFQFLNHDLSILNSMVWMNLVICLVAFISVFFLKETFTRDLNFLE